jgi:hypothetical protein
MPAPPLPNALADKRQLTLILRLVVDERGRLVHGHLLDVEARSLGRFLTWRELTRTVRAGLARQLPHRAAGARSPRPPREATPRRA